MDEPFRNDIPSIRRFLQVFCNDFEKEDDSEETLPVKTISPYLVASEVEAECKDWVLQYLFSRNCPPSLASAIAHATYQEISGIDFTEYLTEELDESEDTCIDDAENDIIANIPRMESSRLAKFTVTKLQEICFKWNKELPKIRIPDRTYTVSTHCIKNSRRKMEDKHVILQDFNNLFNLKDNPSHSYFAVFDGHAGIDAANYAASHLHCNLMRGDNFHKDISEAIIDSYKVTDKNFSHKARREHLNSGTTCVSALFQGSTLHISWLGDSQAVLVRDGVAVSVMNPHKPDRTDETERIEKLGGSVIFYGAWRVNGNIAVSRAIGDVTQKPFICSDADVTSFSLDGTEDYLVLACDGAWDTVPIHQLPEIVYSHLQDPNGSKSTAARHVIKYAKEHGSSDNITVVIIFLRDDIAEPQPLPLETEVSENGGERGAAEKNDKDSTNEKKSKKGDNFQNSQKQISGSSSDKRITQNYECSLSPSRAFIYVDIKKKSPALKNIEVFSEEKQDELFSNENNSARFSSLKLDELFSNEIATVDETNLDIVDSVNRNESVRNKKCSTNRKNIPLTVALPVLIEQSALRLYQADTIASKNWKKQKKHYISILKESATGKENLKTKSLERSKKDDFRKLEHALKNREKSNICWSFTGKTKGGLAPKLSHITRKSKKKLFDKSKNQTTQSMQKMLESIRSRVSKPSTDDGPCPSTRPLPDIPRSTLQPNVGTGTASTSQVVTSLVFGSKRPTDHDVRSDAFYTSRRAKTKKDV